MLNSSQFVDSFGSIQDNFVGELPTLSSQEEEDTFAILSFNDLDFCSSPCLDDRHLLFACPELSPKMYHTDPKMARVTGRTVNQPVSDAEEYFPGGSSALSDLSPGVELVDIDTLLRDPQNPADFLNIDEVGLFLGGGLKGQQGLDEDAGSPGPLSTIEAGGIDAAWLTNAIVIAPNQPKVSSSDFAEESPFAGNSSGKILQEISIPSSVGDSYAYIPDEEEEIDTTGVSVTTEPATSSKRRKRRRDSVDPGSDEYKKKRELNNISVRKSREKARQKQQETEGRVEVLATENNRLQARVDSLEKELTILRGLFTNIGASLPGEVTKFLTTE